MSDPYEFRARRQHERAVAAARRVVAAGGAQAHYPVLDAYCAPIGPQVAPSTTAAPAANEDE